MTSFALAVLLVAIVARGAQAFEAKAAALLAQAQVHRELSASLAYD